jgi:malate dehydrogenase (oxaloacetate-decarboxylating)
MDYKQESIKLHKKTGGKIRLESKVPLNSELDLSLAYTPGVAGPCMEIAEDRSKAKELTIKKNSVAVVTDGSAVLGLGNIGPEASIPVMEGKAVLFKKYADIDAWPIALATQNVDEIVRAVELIAPVFGGINLEDISAPRCFEVENRLQNLGIPVFHDDQHGTAIVVMAALINAAKVTGKAFSDLVVVVNGPGAAGTAITKMLCGRGFEGSGLPKVKEVIVCDATGSIHSGRTDLSDAKKKFLEFTNRSDRSGSLKDVLVGADVFVGVSVGKLLLAEDIAKMNEKAIVFAMANPEPEIMPNEAYKGGAMVVGTGRSDLPNQVNNVLVFPGIFRGALDAHASRITPEMKAAAALALAAMIPNPTPQNIIPSPLNLEVGPIVATAVRKAWR